MKSSDSYSMYWDIIWLMSGSTSTLISPSWMK